MIITIPMELPSAANLREHWAAKAKRVKAQRTKVQWALAYRDREMLELHAALARGQLLDVAFVRVAPRALDDDNLASAFKAIRDELAKQLGTHDGPKGPLRFRYSQEHAAPGVAMVRVSVEPVALAREVET